ncbi:MAG: hypothetical protein ACRD04_08970 [Terriglobales bacterium]
MAMPISAPSQVWEITVPGGKFIPLTHDLGGYANVSMSAGGELALLHSNPQDSVWMQGQRGGAFRQLPGGGSDLDGANGLAWEPDGRLLSVHTLGGDNQLWLEGGGAPAQELATGRLPGETVGAPQIGPDGRIYFTTANQDGTARVWAVNADGTGLTDLTPHLSASLACVAQGGRALELYVARVQSGVEQQNIWLLPLAGGEARQVSPVEVYANFSLVMPGGKSVLVDAEDPHKLGRGIVEELPLGGAAPMAVRPQMKELGAPYDVTPDGRALTGVICKGNVCNIWAAPLDGSKPYSLTHFNDGEIAAYAFAPDGRLAVSRGTQDTDVVLATGLANKP